MSLKIILLKLLPHFPGANKPTANWPVKLEASLLMWCLCNALWTVAPDSTGPVWVTAEPSAKGSPPSTTQIYNPFPCNYRVYSIEITHDYVVVCIVMMVISSGLGDLCDTLRHILQGCFTDTGAWLPQCQWSNPEEYGQNPALPNHNKNSTKREPCDFLELTAGDLLPVG